MEKTEFVPDNVSPNDLKDELHRRSARAGHTSRSGEQLQRTKIMSLPSTKQYEKNYVKAFGHD
jgi:hypothetical protein